jgi:prepilin peptidase CpaA
MNSFAPMTTIELVFACVASLVTVIAALTDFHSRAIPNRLTLPLLCVAPLAHGFVAGPGALGLSLLGAVLAGLVPVFAFARGGLGGGDVKLFAALGALLGVELGLRIELMSLLFAALYASFMLTWRGELLGTLFRSARLAFGMQLTAATPASAELRLGPAIAAATLLSLWLGALLP